MYINQFVQLDQFLIEHPWIVFLVMIWTLFWKGYALWISSKNNSKKWFIILLVVNTVGILDIIFIFYVAKKQWGDLKGILTEKV